MEDYEATTPSSCLISLYSVEMSIPYRSPGLKLSYTCPDKSLTGFADTIPWVSSGRKSYPCAPPHFGVDMCFQGNIHTFGFQIFRDFPKCPGTVPRYLYPQMDRGLIGQGTLQSDPRIITQKVTYYFAPGRFPIPCAIRV
jgi:hypothetical protein